MANQEEHESDKLDALKHIEKGNQHFYYHDQWEWIMPVVVAIEKLGYDVTIIGNRDQKEELIFTTVVEFIKWYNKNEKK